MSSVAPIQINDVSLDQLTYKDAPVVTFQQIADVHGIPVHNVQRSFQRHHGRFVEEKHYFRLDFTQASSLQLGVTANSNGLLLFTEKGYLLLTKPMKDEQSWQVQERMIDDYFALKTEAKKPSALDRYADLRALAETVEAIAELRYENECMKVEILANKDELLVQKDALIAHQTQTIAALHAAQRAEGKADMALAEAHTMTLEDFVVKNALLRQFPRNQWPRCATWLIDFCDAWGLSVVKTPVIAKPWAEENAYPLRALSALLRAETVKPRQLAIVPTADPAE